MSKQMNLFSWMASFDEATLEYVRQRIETALLVPQQYLITPDNLKAIQETLADAVGDTAHIGKIERAPDGSLVCDVSLRYPISRISFTLSEEDEAKED